MPSPLRLFFVLVAFGALGSVFLGLVAGLANVVTGEYVDYSLPGDPIVHEYGFRVGGEYGWITIFLLLGGSSLAVGGNLTGIFALWEYQKVKQLRPSREGSGFRRPVAEVLLSCPSCNNKIPMYSKFCPKCGADFHPDQQARA